MRLFILLWNWNYWHSSFMCAAAAADAGWFSLNSLQFFDLTNDSTHTNRIDRSTDRQLHVHTHTHNTYSYINWSWFRKLTSIDCKSFLKFVLMFTVKSLSLSLFLVRWFFFHLLLRLLDFKNNYVRIVQCGKQKHNNEIYCCTFRRKKEKVLSSDDSFSPSLPTLQLTT